MKSWYSSSREIRLVKDVNSNNWGKKVSHKINFNAFKYDIVTKGNMIERLKYLHDAEKTFKYQKTKVKFNFSQSIP